MNQIKKDLQKELQSMTLSDEKKSAIVRKINRQKKHTTRANWKYRVVLSAFTLLGLGFSYLLLEENKAYMTQTNVTTSQTINVLSIFESDYLKSIVLILLFILLHLLMKKCFYKKQRNLPVCANCSKELSYFQALRQGLKGNKIKCPHCRKTQYRTRQSMMKMDWFNFLLPLMTAVAYLYQNKLLGISLYLLSLMILMIYHSPYIVEFQKEAPTYRFNWRWVFPVILMVVTGWAILESDESYAEPQDAMSEIYGHSTVIPGYASHNQALFFTITDERLLGAHYVNQNIFGWKVNGLTSYPINYREIHEKYYGTVSGKKYLVYGLMEANDNWIVQVDGEDASLLNLDMLQGDELERPELKESYLWYFERDQLIDVMEEKVKLVDRRTGDVLKILTYDKR